MTGRGGWTRIGFPPNATSAFYTFVEPEHVGAAGTMSSANLSQRAVNYGVKSIQRRVNELGWATDTGNEPIRVNGDLDAYTFFGIGWMQGKLGLRVDGRAGQTTMLHALWPVIRDASGGGRWTPQVKHIVGAITAHESGYDPGAVGYEDDHDLGLVQINGPANPTMTEADRFDYRKALTYALDRIKAAIETPGYTVDAAIASYGYPSVAQHWVQTGTELWPEKQDLNDKALAYVAYIRDWSPGF